jgi:antitoxin ParD1/3/4
MRSTMHISLPQPLKRWVQSQVKEKGFGTASEFVRDVLRRQQALENEARARVDAKLQEAIDSGPFTPMTKRDWQTIRREARKRVTSRKKR